MRNLSILSYFNKMASGSIPAEGSRVVSKSLKEGLIKRQELAEFLGVQPKQVVKISGNLTHRKTRELCRHIIDINTPK